MLTLPKRLGMGTSLSKFVGDAPLAGGGASAFASRPAPSGYQWDFVTLNGARVKLNSEPVVALVRVA